MPILENLANYLSDFRRIPKSFQISLAIAWSGILFALFAVLYVWIVRGDWAMTTTIACLVAAELTIHVYVKQRRMMLAQH